MKEVEYQFIDGTSEIVSMEKEELEKFIKAWNEGETFQYDTEEAFVYVDTAGIAKIEISKEEENE